MLLAARVRPKSSGSWHHYKKLIKLVSVLYVKIKIIILFINRLIRFSPVNLLKTILKNTVILLFLKRERESLHYSFQGVTAFLIV
jgi:hypothetical protein